MLYVSKYIMFGRSFYLQLMMPEQLNAGELQGDTFSVCLWPVFWGFFNLPLQHWFAKESEKVLHEGEELLKVSDDWFVTKYLSFNKI